MYQLEWTDETGEARRASMSLTRAERVEELTVNGVRTHDDEDYHAHLRNCNEWLGEALAAIAEGRGRVWKKGGEPQQEEPRVAGMMSGLEQRVDSLERVVLHLDNWRARVQRGVADESRED